MPDREAYAGSWWMVDHFKSDRQYHAYCDDCYRQIPAFLVRYSRQTILPADLCEGCGRIGEEAPHAG